MPLYNLAQLRTQKEKNQKLKKRISDLQFSDSDTITLNHDGIHVETSLDETIAWDSLKMEIVGSMDCTNNPPFPKAHGGSAYVITSDGMFGTYWVEQGDIMMCVADTEESRDSKYEKIWFHFSKSGGGGSMANLPIATSSTVGGILSGGDVLVNSDGLVTVVDDSHKHTLDTLTGMKELLDAKAESNHRHVMSDITDFEEELSAELDAFQDTIKTPMTGASDKNPGTIGMVPRPLAGDQNKYLRGNGTWDNPETKTSLADFGIQATATELSYSSGLTGNIQIQIKNLSDALDLKANTGHTHNYAGSSSVGGSATSAEKVNHTLHIVGASGEIGSFNGSETSSIQLNASAVGAAPVSHGNHVPSFSSANNNQTLMVIDGNLGWGSGGTSSEDPVTYSVFTGTDGSGDGSIGLVPAPKSTDAGKFLGASGSWEKPISTLSDLGISATTEELNYVKGVTSSIQSQLNGKANSSHTHSYASANTPGGNAIAAEKLVNPLTIKLGTSGEILSFDGSQQSSLSITPSAIGAANASHGNHVEDYSEATDGQIYAIVNGSPKWIDNDKRALVGSAVKDHLMVFNDTDGSYKDSGKSIVTSMSESPSQTNILTESAVAAYIESLLKKFSKKSTMILSSFKVTSEGDLITFEDAIVLKRIVLKTESDISATGFKVSRGEEELFSVENNSMINGTLYEYSPYIHLDVSQSPLHFEFTNYSAGSAILYLEYAYDTTRDLDTGESNIYLKSDLLLTDSIQPHSFYANGFLRAITIRPKEAYNTGTKLSIKIGTYTLYYNDIDLTNVNQPITLEFFYPVSATKENPQDMVVKLENYTQGSANFYMEYTDQVTITTVTSLLSTTASQLDADSNRLNEVLDSL